MEYFKDVEGYEGRYKVSNLGSILSCARLCRTRGKEGSVRREREKVLVASPGKDGYLRVSLSLPGKEHAKDFRVHRLVATAFLKNPDGKREVNHIDGNKVNNVVNNLEWSTRKENAEHMSRTGLAAYGERHHAHKLTEEKVLEIRTLFSSGNVTKSSLSRKFNVSRWTIRGILEYKTWRNCT